MTLWLVPARGKKDGVLSDRNQSNGGNWSALDENSQAVFDPTRFFALAGYPIPRKYKGSTDVSTESVHNTSTPSAKDEALYRPLNELLVNEEKVLQEFGNDTKNKVPSGTHKKAKKLLRGIESDVGLCLPLFHVQRN